MIYTSDIGTLYQFYNESDEKQNHQAYDVVNGAINDNKSLNHTHFYFFSGLEGLNLESRANDLMYLGKILDVESSYCLYRFNEYNKLISMSYLFKAGAFEPTSERYCVLKRKVYDVINAFDQIEDMITKKYGQPLCFNDMFLYSYRYNNQTVKNVEYDPFFNRVHKRPLDEQILYKLLIHFSKVDSNIIEPYYHDNNTQFYAGDIISKCKKGKMWILYHNNSFIVISASAFEIPLSGCCTHYFEGGSCIIDYVHTLNYLIYSKEDFMNLINQIVSEIKEDIQNNMSPEEKHRKELESEI